MLKSKSAIEYEVPSIFSKSEYVQALKITKDFLTEKSKEIDLPAWALSDIAFIDYYLELSQLNKLERLAKIDNLIAYFKK